MLRLVEREIRGQRAAALARLPRARLGPRLLEPSLQPQVDIFERRRSHAVDVVVQGDQRRPVFAV